MKDIQNIVNDVEILKYKYRLNKEEIEIIFNHFNIERYKVKTLIQLHSRIMQLVGAKSKLISETRGKRYLSDARIIYYKLAAKYIEKIDFDSFDGDISNKLDNIAKVAGRKRLTAYTYIQGKGSYIPLELYRKYKLVEFLIFIKS